MSKPRVLVRGHGEDGPEEVQRPQARLSGCKKKDLVAGHVEATGRRARQRARQRSKAAERPSYDVERTGEKGMTRVGIAS